MKRSLSIILVSLVLVQCSKSPKCWGEDKNKGIIEEYYYFGCESTDEENINYVINNDSDFVKVAKISCANVPSIDFTKHTLLGMNTGGGCESKYIREVTKNEDAHEYHYKVIWKDCGLCKRYSIEFNWVAVPKLPPGWIVTFELKKK